MPRVGDAVWERFLIPRGDTDEEEREREMVRPGPHDSHPRVGQRCPHFSTAESRARKAGFGQHTLLRL